LQGNSSQYWRKSYNFILIGCGKIGHSYATILGSHPGIKLAAVVDINPEAARAFGTSFRCNSYTSLDEYLATDKMANCAVICTLPSDHAEIACRLMQKGINVLCEQPFALNVVSAEKMIDISSSCGVSLMMGSKFRHVTDIIQTKGLIQAGILGQVLEFEGDFRDTVDMRSRWNIQKEKSGGGVLMDTGSLVVDIARYLFGPVIGIRAEEGQRIQSQDVEDTVKLALRTASGVMGTAHLSWNLKNPGEDYLRIYGTQGNLCLGWKKSRYRPYGAVDWINFGEGFSTQKALTLQLNHFIDVVSGEEISEISPEDEIESVRLIEAAYQSISTGRFLNIQPMAMPAAPLFQGERKFSVLRSEKVPSTA
jgi:predicted dehydrogenase